MSHGIGILAFDLGDFSPTAVDNWYYRRHGMEHLLGEAAPHDSITQVRPLRKFRKLYERLEPPPATNSIHFGDLALNARATVLGFSSPITYHVSYRQPGSGVLIGRFPRFLEERFPDAHRLWCRMLGQRNGEEWIPFTVDGTTYHVDRRGSEGGCIQGDAISELADALDPVLDALPGFYEGIDDPKYRESEAVRCRAIETLHGVCRHLGEGWPDNPTIIAYRS
jgi:hypothetical protein